MTDYKIGDSFRAPNNKNAVYTITKMELESLLTTRVSFGITYPEGMISKIGWQCTYSAMIVHINDGDLVPMKKKCILPEELFKI